MHHGDPSFDRRPDRTDRIAGGDVRADAERLGELIAAQRAVTAAAASGAGLDAVLHIAAEGARNLTGADGVVVEMRDGDHLVYRAAAGSAVAHLGVRVGFHGSLSGLCMRMGTALYAADTETDPRVDRAACRRVGIRSMVVVPVPHHGRYVGVVKLHNPEPHAFDDRDILSAQLIVGVISTGFIGEQEAKNVEALARSEAEAREQAALATAAAAEAEQANRAKDEFLATLSHELRTPLNAILGWTSVLRGPGSTADDLTYGLTVIDRNARAQARIVDDLLDVSRSVCGQLGLDVKRIDARSAVAEAVETVRPDADAKEVTVTLVAAGDAADLQVDADPVRLQQIAWNLLTNAVKFTPAGGTVTATLRRDGAGLELAVADTGQGIKPDFMAHLFERFRQQDGSFTRRHGGLGLGLSIVRQLVELHGGTVSADSAGEGRGATFAVRLPAPPTPAVAELAPVGSDAAAHAAGNAAAGSLGATVRLDGVRVLVVDDEPDAREVVGRLLRDQSADVLTAGSAAEAMVSLRENRPAVLVSDIGMPGRDGYDLIRDVRALPWADGGGVPAVALTAFARPGDRARALRLGYQAYLAKPVEPAELVAKLAALVRGHAGS